MDWIKKNPEKLIAILAGLVGLGLGVKNILEVTGMPDRYVIAKVPPKAELPTPEIGEVDQSSAILKAPFNWSDKAVELGSGARKMVPLFRSVTIIEKDGQLFDLDDPTEDPIRPPVPNEWLKKYNLDYLYRGVLEADPDADGFVTLDEYKANTSPVDAASHPAYWYKLLFVDRKQQNFSLRFAADNDPQFQINVLNRGARSTHFTKVGETFLDGRFTVLGYEKREGLNRSGIKANQSVLKLKDHVAGGEISIVFGEETNYPTYFAELNFTLDPNQKQFYVRVGDTFTLQKEPAVTYKLESIDEAGSMATLKLPDGTEVNLQKGVLSELPEAQAGQ